MLSRPGPLPSGSGWSYELKWDGFRALVSTEEGLAVRSRRGHSIEVFHGTYVKAHRDAIERERAREALVAVGLGVAQPVEVGQ